MDLHDTATVPVEERASAKRHINNKTQPWPPGLWRQTEELCVMLRTGCYNSCLLGGYLLPLGDWSCALSVPRRYWLNKYQEEGDQIAKIHKQNKLWNDVVAVSRQPEPITNITTSTSCFSFPLLYGICCPFMSIDLLHCITWSSGSILRIYVEKERKREKERTWDVIQS